MAAGAAHATILCATCGVESAEPLPETCPICADERQWVPKQGQGWTSTDVHARDGMRIDVVEVESRLWALTSEPAVGIGQRALLVQTEAGNRGRSAARRTADPLRRSLPGLLHGALGAGQ